MRQTLKALSALLAYPSAELCGAIGEIRAVLRHERALPAHALMALEPLLARMESSELLDLQATYTETFDGSRSRSLHLFEHVHGESRDRGAALIDLAGEYMKQGFAIQANEMPDYLPLFCEFLSLLEPAQACEWLGRPAHVLAALEERLQEGDSPYAAVFAALRAMASRSPDADALAELRARMRAEDARSVDERWEDAPVSFSPPAPPSRTGIVARIQARIGRMGSSA
jgi:nitrate reductase delta subunit